MEQGLPALKPSNFKSQGSHVETPKLNKPLYYMNCMKWYAELSIN